MPFEVVHAQHRLAQRRGQRAGHARAHQQRPGQTWAACIGHHIDVGQSGARFGQDLARERQHAADVVAAGQLGHHTAIGLVHVDLAVKRVRQQARQGLARGLHQSHAGLVAR